MSAARRFVLLLTATSIAVILTATTVLAQGGVPNPSGGTSCQSATPHDVPASGAIAPSSFLSAGFPLEFSLRGWLTSQIATQRFASPITRTAAARVLARRTSGR